MMRNSAEDTKPVCLPLLDERMLIIRLPNGKLMGNLMRSVDGVQEVAARYSEDNGLIWSEAETLCQLPIHGGEWLGLEALLDSSGELHLFFLKYADADTEDTANSADIPHGYLGGYNGRRLDIWHVKSASGRTSWQAPRMIWKGYTGALNSVIQMTNGRILLPFSEQAAPRSFGGGGEDLAAFTHTGSFKSTALYSDDAGETWHLSDSSLSVQVPSFVHSYGADEPVVIELRDGRVWMLMRTQQGRFYESFSADGASWSQPQPTSIISSDSPAGLVRLDDGRIVLFCNVCQRFPYAYGGRHVLHAAISDDEGKSWRGYREVARDPKRNEPPPPHGDFGTAYPFPTVANDGKVVYCTGQGAGRVLLMLLEPDWLLETSQQADFSAEVDSWSTFGTRGVEFAVHPDKPAAKVLSIRKPERDWPAAAVWNFPCGLQGRLGMRLMLNRGFGGALVGLTDHFSTPFDVEDKVHNLFNLQLAPSGELSAGAALELGRWHELLLDWSHAKRQCRVILDGCEVGVLPLLRETTGACYLRLRSTAEEIDNAGFVVESVEVDVAPD